MPGEPTDKFLGNLGEEKREGERLKEFFKKEFSKSFQIEEQEIFPLKEYTSGLKNNPSKELLDIYNLVNESAIDGGFDEALVNPNKKAKVDAFIPFNCYVFPERYLKSLKDLSSSVQSDYTRAFVAKGLKEMVEQQAQFKEGGTLKAVKDFFEKKEAALGAHEDEEKKTKEFYKIYREKEISPENKDLEQLTALKEEEAGESISIAAKLDRDLEISARQLPTKARTQFVEKIKKEKNRNVVEDIAVLETLFDLLDAGVMNGLTIEEKEAEECLKELCPESILDKDTRNAIIKKSKEIRKELKESY